MQRERSHFLSSSLCLQLPEGNLNTADRAEMTSRDSVCCSEDTSTMNVKDKCIVLT